MTIKFCDVNRYTEIKMKDRLIPFCLLLPCLVFAESDKRNKEKNKLAEDPTRVTTKLGGSYNNDYDLNDSGVTFSGSVALDPVRKLNVSVNEDASEWRVGGSWLFDIGIVNFSFGRNEFETGAQQNNYSVGTFIPLSYFDFEPFGVQIFPMAGYSYNDGEQVCDIARDECPEDAKPSLDSNLMLVSHESHSAYLGAFALKPLTESLTLMMFTGGSLGSKDYSGYWFGGGLGYTLFKAHSIGVFTYKMDNSYGANTAFGLSYSYTF